MENEPNETMRSGRTALDLQTEERLDLAEFAEACRAIGWTVDWLGDTQYGILLPSGDYERWDGEAELSVLAFALRDAVRMVAPMSHCWPVRYRSMGSARLRQIVSITADRPTPLIAGPHDAGPYDTETECWARALVALYRAGLLPGGKG